MTKYQTFPIVTYSLFHEGQFQTSLLRILYLNLKKSYKLCKYLKKQHKSSRFTCCPWSHGLQQKNLMLVWQCHQLLSGFLANDHSHQSLLSANNKGDNEVKLRAMHRSLSIYIMAEKTSARRSSDKDCATNQHLKWGPLPSNEVSRTTKHVREGEGRKEKDREDPLIL